jgi:hypothetical protein
MVLFGKGSLCKSFCVQELLCVKACVCVHRLYRRKTSIIQFTAIFSFSDSIFAADLFRPVRNFHIYPAGGDRDAAWLSPTKLHAVG